MAKKHNPNSIIFKFSVNGVPVLSKDDTDNWFVLQDVDEHFEDDPNDNLGKKAKKEEDKLKSLAETANKIIGGSEVKSS